MRLNASVMAHTATSSAPTFTAGTSPLNQKRELIEKLLKANPERSDRATAAIAKTSPQTPKICEKFVNFVKVRDRRPYLRQKLVDHPLKG
jgi:hypothetical protein